MGLDVKKKKKKKDQKGGHFGTMRLALEGETSDPKSPNEEKNKSEKGTRT